MTDSKDLPDIWLEETKAVVVKVFGQIGVIGDDERKAQRPAFVAASIIEACDGQQGGVGNVQYVRLELREGCTHGCAGKGEMKLRVQRERVALHSNDGETFELRNTAIGGEDEDFVPEFAELADGLAERGYDAVGFG